MNSISGARLKLSPCARLESDRVTGKPLLIYPRGVLLLNRTGYEVVSRCTGQITWEQLLSEVAQVQGEVSGVSRAEVERWVLRLQDRQLLENEPMTLAA